MYDPKLYIVSPTVTGPVLQVFEVLEVRAPPPHPSLGTYFKDQNIYLIHTCFNAGSVSPHAVHLNPLFLPF